MKIQDLTKFLEEIAPSSYQESYDNAGLIVGDPNEEVKAALLCLDSTEAVVDEAIEKGCNLIIAHHPIVFKGLKRFNGRSYVERVVMKAIKNDIAIYAIHTNLDNVYHQGVNAKISEKIGLINTRILAPKANLKKLFTFVPTDRSEAIRAALFEAGAGKINGHQHLSYATVGVGSQNGSGGAQVKLEVSYAAPFERAITNALQEQLGEAAFYDIVKIENKNHEVGSGMIGELSTAMKAKDFLQHLKQSMELDCIKYTDLCHPIIKRVALCGGSGGFLLSHAKRQRADIFITADYKYHEFFDADGQIIIADIGHFESERFTIDLLHEILTKKFRNFAAHCTEVRTNPVHYLC